MRRLLGDFDSSRVDACHGAMDPNAPPHPPIMHWKKSWNTTWRRSSGKKPPDQPASTWELITLTWNREVGIVSETWKRALDPAEPASSSSQERKTPETTKNKAEEDPEHHPTKEPKVTKNKPEADPEQT